MTAPKPGDVVVEPAVTGDHRYLAAFALHNVTPLPGTIGTWARTGEDPRGGMGAEIRIAKALATIEHNARPQWLELHRGNFLAIYEGASYLFAIETSDGWTYFDDAIVWDAETPPDWRDGSHGWTLEETSHYMVRPEPPKEPSR